MANALCVPVVGQCDVAMTASGVCLALGGEFSVWDLLVGWGVGGGCSVAMSGPCFVADRGGIICLD